MDPIKPPQQQHQRQQLSDDVKKDVTDAFRHPPVQSLKSFGTKEHQLHTQEEIRQQQLPTPLDSRQSSSSEKRRLSEESSSSGSGNGDWLLPKKRRRSSTRPLLTLEQKRLNHSHSEQKRRLLCKQAYERCLRLITNVEDYKNDLVSALAVTLLKKKSKRKQINKDGLPNLLKHTALLKVSAEILKIRGKNEKLRELLSQWASGGQNQDSGGQNGRCWLLAAFKFAIFWIQLLWRLQKFHVSIYLLNEMTTKLV